MAEVVSVKVTGLAELQKNLEQIPPKIAKGVLRRGLAAGARVFQNEMKIRAARATGFLIEHIAIRVRARGDDLQGIALVGPTKSDYPRRNAERGGKGRTISAATVARFLEFGTSKMKARPFIRQSFETKKNAALDAFVDAAKAAFEAATR